ncbi:15087_t:CDS:2, partial [Dentiscutata heterogama]
DKPKGNCFKCGKPGHFARNCYSNTKRDSFNNVNNWKLKKKRFCSQCGKPYPRHHPGCTRNNETHMNGKKVGRRTVPMAIRRFKKGNFSKKPYNKGKGKLYKGKFTKKKFRHYEGNEEERLSGLNLNSVPGNPSCTLKKEESTPVSRDKNTSTPTT